MNTLTDALNDLIVDVINNSSAVFGHPEITDKTKQTIIEEYVERIKNELNVGKYLT
jgi:hypothetical protein